MKRVVAQVLSASLNGSVKLAMECGKGHLSKQWATKILRMTLEPEMQGEEGMGGIKKENFKGDKDDVLVEDWECLEDAGGPFERVKGETPWACRTGVRCGVRH